MLNSKSVYGFSRTERTGALPYLRVPPAAPAAAAAAEGGTGVAGVAANPLSRPGCWAYPVSINACTALYIHIYSASIMHTVRIHIVLYDCVTVL